MDNETYSEATRLLNEIGAYQRRINNTNSFEPDKLKVYIEEYPDIFAGFVSAVKKADAEKLAKLEDEFDKL